ncbi:hypothetical protein Tco_1207907, partial [Tanacetum coccineum]
MDFRTIISTMRHTTSLMQETTSRILFLQITWDASKGLVSLYIQGTIENITIRRVIEIEILNGNRVELMMWSKMATWFDIKYFEAIEKPVFISVSSYQVSDYIGIMWHSSTVSPVPSAGGNRLVYANGTGLP